MHKNVEASKKVKFALRFSINWRLHLATGHFWKYLANYAGLEEHERKIIVSAARGMLLRINFNMSTPDDRSIASAALEWDLKNKHATICYSQKNVPYA